MGYPIVSNPSEKLRYDEIKATKLSDGYYRVVAIINGEFSLRDVQGKTKKGAIDNYKHIEQHWAKYLPNYEELDMNLQESIRNDLNKLDEKDLITEAKLRWHVSEIISPENLRHVDERKYEIELEYTSGQYTILRLGGSTHRKSYIMINDGVAYESERSDGPQQYSKLDMAKFHFDELERGGRWE